MVPPALLWRLEQEDQRLKKHDGRWIDIQHLSCIFYLLSSSSSSHPNQTTPSALPAPASHGWKCCRGGLTAPYYSHRWPGPAATAASHRS